MSLHCIWSTQPSSIGAVPMIRFSAWHDKCLPASAFVAMKDKMLVVVFPSAEICNNIMITFTGAPVPPFPLLSHSRHSSHLFSFSSSERSFAYPPHCHRWRRRSIPIYLYGIKSVSITRPGGSALATVEIPYQSLVTLLEGSAYFLTIKKWPFIFLEPDRHYDAWPSLRQAS